MGGRLAGKVAMITGGTGGMGESHARAFVREGAKVMIADIDDARGDDLAEELGPGVRYVHLDVTSTEDWSAAVAGAVSIFGKLDVLVNNAGILGFSPIDEYSDDDWDRIIAINLTGAFKGIRAALPALKEAAPSSIINVSSTAGLKGFPNVAGYNASKFGSSRADEGRCARTRPRWRPCELGPPGEHRHEDDRRFFSEFPHVAMGRAGRPEEVSEMIVFLAGDESSFATGAEFVLDGGETAGLPIA